MNLKLNKDITEIKESIVWDLPLRETIWGGITLGIGGGVYYYLTHTYEPSRLIPIITAVCCLPTGFITVAKYQGLTGEQILVELFRSLFIKLTVLEPENDYDSYARQAILNQQREALRNDKIAKKENKRKKN